MRVGLIGKGYWGSIIKKKLVTPIDLVFEADSKFNYDPFLNQIDWAFVATPPKTHYAIVKKLLEKGINVFCEKPFTGKPQEAITLFELARAKKKRLYINNIFLYRKVYLQFKEQIEERVKNKIHKIEFIWNKYGPFKDSIKNDLFYHDAYLFLDITRNIRSSIDLQSIEIEQKVDQLTIRAEINEMKVIFAYDRQYKGEKHKLIKVNGNIICDFSLPDNDPLNEMIQLLLFREEQFDFEESHALTIETEHLINLIELHDK